MDIETTSRYPNSSPVLSSISEISWLSYQITLFEIDHFFKDSSLLQEPVRSFIYMLIWQFHPKFHRAIYPRSIRIFLWLRFHFNYFPNCILSQSQILASPIRGTISLYQFSQRFDSDLTQLSLSVIVHQSHVY